MLISVVQSATGIIVRMKILTQATAYPSGLTGLTSASTGLIISTIADNEATPTTYTVAGSTIEAVTTLGTYVAPTATKCRFKEVDATNHPGICEMHFANARYAISNSKYLLISIAGTTTNLIQSDALIQLQTFDPYSITNPVNATQLNGASLTARDIGASVLLSTGTGTGQLDFTSGVVKANLAQILGTALTETAGLIAGAFKQFFNVASPTSTLNTITTVTNLTNTPTTGDFNATQKTSLNAATPASVVGNVGGVAGVTFPANVASPTNITAGTIANLTNAPSNGDFTATMKTSLNAATPASVQNISAQTGDTFAGLTTVNNNVLALPAVVGARVISTAPTAGTWDEALAFALSGMGKGKVTYVHPSAPTVADGVLTIYAKDGTTVLKTFNGVTVDALGNVTARA